MWYSLMQSDEYWKKVMCSLISNNKDWFLLRIIFYMVKRGFCDEICYFLISIKVCSLSEYQILASWVLEGKRKNVEFVFTLNYWYTHQEKHRTRMTKKQFLTSSTQIITSSNPFFFNMFFQFYFLFVVHIHNGCTQNHIEKELLQYKLLLSRKARSKW